MDAHNCFREKLNLDSSPIQNETTRVRVQARQTYCFAIATNLGWDRGKDVLQMGVDNLLSHCFLPIGLPAVNIRPGHGPVNQDVDLYDVAFVLFALSHAAKTLNDDKLRERVRSLISRISDVMKRPAEIGGFAERLPPHNLREQNPHMHLLEGLLAAYQATSDPRALTLARDLVSFARKTFIDPVDGGLHEFGPIIKTDIIENDRYETGHQFEWVWLLYEKARLENQPVAPFVTELAKKGFELRARNGRIPLSHHLSGADRETFMRTWGITEAIKAYSYLTQYGETDHMTDLVKGHEILFSDHLRSDGSWIDMITPNGERLSKDVPASTFYHVVFALNQILSHPV